jgi:signal transduction histidine kinase
MSSRLTRALLVVAVFAALATLSVTGSYVVGESSGQPPSASKPFGLLWWAYFRYFLAWAIVTPGVVWLGRRVPLARAHPLRAVLFHLVVPVVLSPLFVLLRLLLNAATSGHMPSLGTLLTLLPRLLVVEPLSVIPVYWLLLAAAWIHQFYQEYEAVRFRAVELHRSLAAAELDALQMKLQPHFLFNTLNAIGTLAREGDRDAVARVVEHLGTLLRLSMDHGNRQFVSLDEELSLVDEYLAIEEVRFGDQLRVVRQIDPRVRLAKVPNMILQPLVENALVHGIAGRIGASLLEVSSRADGGSLVVSVRDDGPGVGVGWTLARDARRGLGNVAERMAALFGDAGAVQLSNAADGGAVAVLRMPLDIEDGSPAKEHR